MEIEDTPNENKTLITINENELSNWKSLTLNGQLEYGENIIRLGIYAFGLGKNDIPESVSKYHISDPNTYNSVIIFLKENIREIFEKLLNLESKINNTAKRILVHKSSQWNSYKNLIEDYLSNLNYFLSQISDPNMQFFILQHINELIIYYIPFSNLQNALLDVILPLTCSVDERIRIESFLLLRKLVYEFPYPFITVILKETYVIYTKFSSSLTRENSHINEFLLKCIVELCRIDFIETYKLGYECVQEILQTIQKAKETGDIEEYVYNWKYINSIKAWCYVISEYPHQEELKQLLYVLSQIIEETICLKSSDTYIPLKFHCIEMLIHLGNKFQAYVNALPYILRTFESRFLINEARKTDSKCNDLKYLLKIPKIPQVTQYSYQIFNISMNLLIEYLLNYSSSIAFPELAYTVTSSLTKFMNKTKNPQFKKDIKNLIDKIESICTVIQNKRSNLNIPISELLASNAHLIDVQTQISKLKQIKRGY